MKVIWKLAFSSPPPTFYCPFNSKIHRGTKCYLNGNDPSLGSRWKKTWRWGFFWSIHSILEYLGGLWVDHLPIEMTLDISSSWGLETSPNHLMEKPKLDVIQCQCWQMCEHWGVIIPEKSLASFTRHDIEVIAIGLVPTYTADLQPAIVLIYVDDVLFWDGICFFTAYKVNMAPAFFRSHLQGFICISWTGTKKTQGMKALCREILGTPFLLSKTYIWIWCWTWHPMGAKV